MYWETLHLSGKEEKGRRLFKGKEERSRGRRKKREEGDRRGGECSGHDEENS